MSAGTRAIRRASPGRLGSRSGMTILATSAALVVGRQRPLQLSVGDGLRRHGDELAVAVLDRRVRQLVVLSLLVEADAWAGADIVGDVGGPDGVGQRLGVGGAGALVGVGGDQQGLEG